jgi:hypothetical protein
MDPADVQQRHRQDRNSPQCSDVSQASEKLALSEAVLLMPQVSLSASKTGKLLQQSFAGNFNCRGFG